MSGQAELTAFLLAQLDADEAVARAVPGRHWYARDGRLGDDSTGIGCFDWIGEAEAEHAARHDPARVLATVAAHRAIVEYATGQHTSSAEGMDIVRALAGIYADRPGYDEAWR